MNNLTRKRICLAISAVQGVFDTPISKIPVRDYGKIADGADIRVISYNIKCLDLGDYYGSRNIYRMTTRLCAQLISLDADSIGMQEVTDERIVLFDKYLREYSHVGVARDDGEDQGEYNLIFYKTDKYRAISSGTFWLSDTPDVAGSAFEKSRCTRICTWALLENKKTGQRYVHINTHLDHGLDKIREMQTAVLLSQIEKLGLKKYPAVLTGDFNATPDSLPVKYITEHGFDNARDTAPVTDRGITFNNWGAETGYDESVIDYIFIDGGNALVYDVINSCVDERLVSDHHGIYADISLD